MRRFRRGFTIIEVSLFLAITGLLFLGVTLGVQNSMRRQRYNDIVQSFADYLRNLYSEVTNVQSMGNGRSMDVVYGKLVVFGGTPIQDENIFSYDVIGGLTNSGAGNKDVLSLLDNKSVGARVVDDNGSVVGIMNSYKLKWGALLQTTKKPFEAYKGAVLIVRHPSSGTVYTLSSTSDLFAGSKSEDLKKLSGNFGKYGFSETENANFCINPDNGGNDRANVRMKVGASNSSGVEVFYDEGNACER